MPGHFRGDGVKKIESIHLSELQIVSGKRKDRIFARNKK